MFGAGGGTVSYEEIHEADVILLGGSNAREAHPIFFHHLMKGIDNGAQMYCVDPRRTSSAQFADVWLGIEVGSDIVRRRALLMHVLMIPAIVIPTVVIVTMIVGIAAEPTAAHRLR